MSKKRLFKAFDHFTSAQELYRTQTRLTESYTQDIQRARYLMEIIVIHSVTKYVTSQIVFPLLPTHLRVHSLETLKLFPDEVDVGVVS